MRHFSSNNLRDEKKGPIKFLFAFFSWCVFSQGLSLFLVPLRPVCSDCQKVAPFLYFFLQLTDKSFAQRFRNILTCARRQSATIPKHLDLCVLTDTILMLCNSIRDFCLHVCLFSSTYFYLLLDLVRLDLRPPLTVGMRTRKIRILLRN